jgi:hypothetical protein
VEVVTNVKDGDEVKDLTLRDGDEVLYDGEFEANCCGPLMSLCRGLP